MTHSDLYATPDRGAEPAAAVQAELIRRGTHVQHHARWSLHDHLVSTYNILSAWHQPEPIKLAGLTHSVYSTDNFLTATFRRDERRELQRLIGEAAERLTYLFGAVRRSDIFDKLFEYAYRPSDSILLLDRHDGSAMSASIKDLANLSLIHVANLAEQECSADGSPSPWLAKASRLASVSRKYVDHIPPIFNHCAKAIAPDHEHWLIRAYGDAVSNQHTTGEASSALRVAFDGFPFIAEPAVIIALYTFLNGDLKGAASYARRAQALFWSSSFAWDKRLTFPQWSRIAKVVIDAADLDPASSTFLRQRLKRIVRDLAFDPQRLYASLEANALFEHLDDARPVVPARFIEYISRFSMKHTRPSMNHYPGLPQERFYDGDDIPLVRDLEASASQIISEFTALSQGSFHSEAEQSVKRDG